MTKKRIQLSPGFHAEPGETRGHLHDVYTTEDVGENARIHVGALSKAAVNAWQKAAGLGPDAAAEPCDCKIGDCKRITRRCLEERP